MSKQTFQSMTWILVLSIMILILFGCSKEKVTGPDGEPPTIPPKESFVMDFSDFLNPGSMEKVGQNQVVLSKNHWGYAALNVGIWNTIITVGLAIPVASFVASFDQDKEPTQLDDGTWVWEYDFTVLNIKHTASLHGKMTDSGVEWKMYISKENVYSDFLWYTGGSNYLATEGSWILFESPDNPDSLLEILWERDPGAGTAAISYTNIKPNGPENGGYIFYGINNESPYNAFYHIYNKGQNNLTEIEWNRTSKDGRVKDAKHYSNEDWHYWNSSLDDVTGG